MLLTRSPVSTNPKVRFVPRLACIKPAASVRPEPGSNSPLRDRKTLDVLNDTKQRRLESHHDVRRRLDDLIPHRLWGYIKTRWPFNATKAYPSRRDAPRFPSVLCHWLLAPCAVLKERSHGPAGFRHDPAKTSSSGGRLPVGHRLLRPGRLPSGAERYQARFGPCKPGRRRNRLPGGTRTVSRRGLAVNRAARGQLERARRARSRSCCERNSLRVERFRDWAPKSPWRPVRVNPVGRCPLCVR